MDDIILFLLSVLTIRDIIAALGIVKFNDKLPSRFIYGKFNKEIIKRALMELGYNDINIVEHSVKVNNAQKRYKNSICDARVNVDTMILLLSKYTVSFEDNVIYGKNTPTRTKFYINTMEAAKNSEDLLIMTELIEYLLTISIRNKTIPRMPDFVITPKNGNPLLGSKYAEKNNSISIFVKSEKDPSNTHSAENQTYRNFSNNYEGALQLIAKSKEREDDLYGVAMDCNVSGGSNLLSVMKNFNSTISGIGQNIKPVNSAYVMFRVDKDDIDIDQYYQESGFEIFRYFDMGEESKKILVEIREKNEKPFSKNRKLYDDFIKSVEIKINCEEKK